MDGTLLDTVEAVIRDFDREKDGACVYSCWIDSWLYDKFPVKSRTNHFLRPYKSEKRKQITSILKKASVRILAIKGDPITIIGFCVFTDTHLDWIYVKLESRNQKFGNLLCPKNIKTVTADSTKIGRAIARKKNLIIQGEQNGREETHIKD